MSSIVISIVILVAILVAGYNFTKYEGRTAKDWYYEYIEAENTAEQKNQELETQQEQLTSLESEIELNQCIDKANKFYFELFNATCKKMEQEKNISRQQCTIALATNGAVTSLADAKEEDKQKCIKDYLEK